MSETAKPWEKYESGPWDSYAANQPITQDTGDQSNLSLAEKFNPYSAGDRLNAFVGITDVLATGITAGAAEVISGIAGLTQLALSGDPDFAAERVEKVQNFLTIGPMTESGRAVLDMIAPPLSKANFAVKDFAEDKSGGDPMAAAAIETAIWASADLAGAVVPSGKVVLGNVKIRRMRKQVQSEMERLGINPHLDHFRDDVARAARDLGSESAGEQAEAYVLALRNAEKLARQKKNSLYLKGLDESLFIETSPIRKMGAELSVKLFEDGFDLDADDMGVVRRTLDDMHSKKLGFAPGQNLTVHFNHLELLRKRINHRISNSDGAPKAALINIKRNIDDWLTGEFNKAAMENGQAITSNSALSGDIEGLNTYLAARKAAQEHAWFNDTKVISDLIKKDTSVDQFAQWLIGASAISKKGAASVVNKMKLLLGEDHPAFDAVRADFIYQLTEPLLQIEPNFRQFAYNYDRVLRKNKPLVDALGLQESDVAVLADFARVADQLPASGKFYSMREIIQTIARLGVGHGVAKGAARVTFATKVGNALGRVDAVTQKQIVEAAMNVRFDEPVIPKGSPAYSAIIAGAAISGMVDQEDK